MFGTKKELDSGFSVDAAFYKLKTDDRIFLCRSLAAIRRRDCQEERIDALFVLLNPGKCLPVVGEEGVPLLSGNTARLPLLPANPDNTMYQLMRLMERMNWNHVQVINLTDLRTGKFAEFQEGRQFMKEKGESRHNIFSTDRYAELKECIGRADLVIAGWGIKSSVSPIAASAHAILTELGPVNGLAHESDPLYYHPFPWIQGKCVQWLNQMEEQLKGAEQAVRN